MPDDFETQIFGEPLADLGGKAVVNAPCAKPGHINNRQRRGSRNRDYEPNYRGKCETTERSHFEPERVAGAIMANDNEGDEKYRCGDRRQRDKGEIDATVEPLTRATIGTIEEMLLIVATHLRCNSRNVVTPSSQNFPHEGVDTLLVHMDYSRIGSKGSS
jgi:hypothetical protein